MDFYAILDHVIALLQQRGKASYRALQLQFKLDDASLDVLKEELIKVHELARRCSCGRVTRPLPRQLPPNLLRYHHPLLSRHSSPLKLWRRNDGN